MCATVLPAGSITYRFVRIPVAAAPFGSGLGPGLCDIVLRHSPDSRGSAAGGHDWSPLCRDGRYRWQDHVRKCLRCPAIRRRVSSELRPLARGARCLRAERVSNSRGEACEDADGLVQRAGLLGPGTAAMRRNIFDPPGNTPCCRASSFPVRCANAATSHSAAMLAQLARISMSPRRCRRVRRVACRTVDRTRRHYCAAAASVAGVGSPARRCGASRDFTVSAGNRPSSVAISSTGRPVCKACFAIRALAA